MSIKGAVILFFVAILAICVVFIIQKGQAMDEKNYGQETIFEVKKFACARGYLLVYSRTKGVFTQLFEQDENGNLRPVACSKGEQDDDQY